MKIHAEQPKLDKWVKEISAQDSVQEAARYPLRNRLACVQHFFALAAVSGVASVDDVHQLRVATRRASAVLDLYTKLLPTKPTERLRRSLKKIQRVAGTVRDLDVLANRYNKVELSNAKRLVIALNRRRSKMLLRLTKLYQRLRQGDRFLDQCEQLIRKVRTSDTPDERAGIWMKMRWSQLVEQFVKSADVDTQNLDALHRFRICSKKLRYGMELLAPAFDPQLIERAYGFVERLQEGLGQIHDHVFAGKMFHGWDKKRNRVSRECNLKLLIKGEDIMLRNELNDLGTWWTPSVMADMRLAFDQLAILDSRG